MHKIIQEVEALLPIFVMLFKGTYAKCTPPRPRTAAHFRSALVEVGDTLQLLRTACKPSSLAHLDATNIDGSASAEAVVVHSAIDLNLVAENLDTIRDYIDHLLGIHGENDAKYWFQYLAVFRTAAENITTAARISGNTLDRMAAVDEEPRGRSLTTPAASPPLIGTDDTGHERDHSSLTETRTVLDDDDQIRLVKYYFELKAYVKRMRTYAAALEAAMPSNSHGAAAPSDDGDDDGDWRGSESTAASADSVTCITLLQRDIEAMEAEIVLIGEKSAIAEAEYKATTPRWERIISRIVVQPWVLMDRMKWKIERFRIRRGTPERRQILGMGNAGPGFIL